MPPPLVLTARAGDPQAAKAAVAAAASSCALSFSPSQAEKTFGTFAGKIELRLPSGAALHEPNAAARAAAQGKLEISESWLGWEERTLRPAIYRSEAPPPQLRSYAHGSPSYAECPTSAIISASLQYAYHTISRHCPQVFRG
jgi:hypothetical protein